MDEGQHKLYESIDQLLSAGSLEEARARLGGAPPDSGFQVLSIKLGLLDGSLPPGMAMQKLIQLMRKTPDLPGAKALYQEAAKLAYSGRESSVSHSHPPPPVRPGAPKR